MGPERFAAARRSQTPASHKMASTPALASPSSSSAVSSSSSLPSAASPTAFTHITGYKFVDLPDRDALRQPFRDESSRLGLKGLVLLCDEGINYFVAGSAAACAGFLKFLHRFDFELVLEILKLKLQSELFVFVCLLLVDLQQPISFCFARRLLRLPIYEFRR